MVFTNPPDHTRLRRLVSSAFTTRHVEDLRTAVTTRADLLLDRLAVEPRADFMTEVALALPVGVISDLLGVPEPDQPTFIPWARDFGAVLSPGADADSLNRAVAAETSLVAYFIDLLADKRRNPSDDLLSRRATSHADDALTEDEMISTAILLFGAGFETTTNLLGNGLRALLTHPDQFARLYADPGLVPAAVEELLRYDSPVQIDARTVLEPAVLAGTNLAPGTMVITMLGAANHDPAQFTDPDTLNITRPDTGHLAFAAGIHFCLGAHLTRLETHVLFTQLITRFASIEAAGEPERRPGLALRGYARLPVTLRP
jgi:cytochrome P450